MAEKVSASDIRQRIYAVLNASDKPMDFERIYKALEAEGKGLPEDKPKLVVRKILYGTPGFQSSGNGLFVIAEGATPDNLTEKPAGEVGSDAAGKSELAKIMEQKRANMITRAADSRNKPSSVSSLLSKALPVKKAEKSAPEKKIDKPAAEKSAPAKTPVHKAPAHSQKPEKKEEKKHEPPAVKVSSAEIKAGIFDVLTEAGKPMDFEKIYAQMESSGKPLPSDKPKLVVRKILYGSDIFESSGKGLFLIKAGTARPDVSGTSALPAEKSDADIKQPVAEPEVSAQPQAASPKAPSVVPSPAPPPSVKQSGSIDTSSMSTEEAAKAVAVQAAREAIAAAREAAEIAAKEVAEEARAVAAERDKKLAEEEALRAAMEAARTEAVKQAAREAAETAAKEAAAEAARQAAIDAARQAAVEEARRAAIEAAKQIAIDAAREVARQEAAKHAVEVAAAIAKAEQDAAEAKRRMEAAEAARRAATEAAERAEKEAAAETQRRMAAEAAAAAQRETAAVAARQAADLGDTQEYTAPELSTQEMELAAPSSSSSGSSIRERIVAVIEIAGKPLDFNEIYAGLKNDEYPLPANDPREVVKKILSNPRIFISLDDGTYAPNYDGE